MSSVTCGGEADDDPEPKDASELLQNRVYAKLRGLAGHLLAKGKPAQTLQPAALVHAAWLRQAAKPARRFNSDRHLLWTLLDAMRRILLDNARRKKPQRHG